MKTKFKYLLFALLFISANCYSQFPVKVNLLPNGAIIQSPTTTLGKKYSITIEGLYSMWPEYNGYGCDANFVYDVPQEEIDALRWPPKELFGSTIVGIPHWVGDDKDWDIPPKSISTPLFSMSFRKHIGFRIDNEPLPNSDTNLATHRYIIEKVGTGQPFKFQILDSNYSIISEKTVPRYEDNSGSLKISIDEISDSIPEPQICDIKPICDGNGKIIAINLEAGLFIEDTTNPSNEKNLLSEINMNQIGLVADGEFLCSPDSIVCASKTKKSIATGLVVDRSGSMGGPISDYDNTIRIDASKSAINRFVDNMKNNDSTFVISFSNDISLDVDWTNDKNIIKNDINNLSPGGSTSFYGALIEALNKISLSSNPVKAIIALSDGGNNLPPDWSANLLSMIQQKSLGVKIYIIALGLTSEQIDIDGRQKMEQIASATNGKVYDVNNASKLDSVYQVISNEIVKDKCCKIYFKIPQQQCNGETRFVRLIYAPSDTIIKSKVISYECNCDSSTTSGVRNLVQNAPINIQSIVPNPISDTGNLTFSVNNIGVVKITVSNFFGDKMYEDEMQIEEPGIYNYQIKRNNLVQGDYWISIFQDEKMVARKIIFIK